MPLQPDSADDSERHEEVLELEYPPLLSFDVSDIGLPKYVGLIPLVLRFCFVKSALE